MRKGGRLQGKSKEERPWLVPGLCVVQQLRQGGRGADELEDKIRQPGSGLLGFGGHYRG